MNIQIWSRIWWFWYADAFSPAGFVRRALMIGVAYLLATLAGLREYTSVLNGTVGPESAGWGLSAFLGCAYIMIYLAFVILAPVLILAAAILSVWRRLRERKSQV